MVETPPTASSVSVKVQPSAAAAGTDRPRYRKAGLSGQVHTVNSRNWSEEEAELQTQQPGSPGPTGATRPSLTGQLQGLRGTEWQREATPPPERRAGRATPEQRGNRLHLKNGQGQSWAESRLRRGEHGKSTQNQPASAHEGAWGPQGLMDPRLR